MKLVRIHSLTVDGRVGVCIFAWHSSGRNRNFFEVTCPESQTSADDFKIRPNPSEEFIMCPNSIYDIRTSLQFFGIDPDDFDTMISELFRRRSTDGGVKFSIFLSELIRTKLLFIRIRLEYGVRSRCQTLNCVRTRSEAFAVN